MDPGTMQTVSAFVRLGCMILSSILSMVGIAMNVDNFVVIMTCIVQVAIAIWSWWKNNNITKEASEAQKVLDELKATRD